MSPQSAAFGERLGRFCRTNVEEIHPQFLDLLHTVWADGRPRPDASELARQTGELFQSVPDGRRGHLAVLLGLLTETAESDDHGLRGSVRAGLDGYLRQLATLREGDPSGAALVYLLAHFPEDAARILRVARSAALDQDDLSRLERCLAAFDPDAPAIGRTWPSPIRWALDDAERDQERRWFTALEPDAVSTFWEKDTRTLLAYMGGRACAAITTGRVLPEVPPEPGPEVHREPAGPASPPPGAHADLFRCPACGGRLARDAAMLACRSCAVDYPSRDGYLDLSGEPVGAGDQIAGNSPLYLSRYESLLRPAFLRINGTNWNGALSVADEDGYLAEHVRPADGPLLDLGAGTGRWTRVLADRLGGERVIAFDLAAAMVGRLREVVPESLVVRGAGGRLPFGDASLGAVNCWNTVQSIERPDATLHEVGRCLRPGGTFTMLTYRPSPDPLYRYFQRCHESCLGVTSFDQKDMEETLASAGMTVVDEYTPGTFLIVTAVRR
ncbi:class I SAM-dependent methyltransferase [Actinomadura chokoriensis]|uniref:Class I SAM-dependent methyltransferase n=1 Tax=Actinomadura chokoriensis TaxID=454156 RepID=A0ABV4R2I7_9ACTN